MTIKTAASSSSMNTPTTFIFDCFGVIGEPVLSHWYRDNSAKFGFTDERLQDVYNQSDLGLLSEADVVERFSKYAGVTSTKEQIRAEIDGYLKMDEEMLALIRGLREHGFKTALLSNADHAFFERKVYEAYPAFKDAFDEIVISSAVGMVKPDKDIYQHTLDKLGSSASESLFIDDNPTNVEAAMSLGMQGYVFTDKAAFAEYLRELGVLGHEQTREQRIR